MLPKLALLLWTGRLTFWHEAPCPLPLLLVIPITDQVGVLLPAPDLGLVLTPGVHKLHCVTGCP